MTTVAPVEALTLKGYYREIDRLEDEFEDRKEYISDEEREEIVRLNAQAHEVAMYQLVLTHRSEYESYVQKARQEYGIDDKVESEWFALLDSLDPLDFPTRL